MKPDMRMLCLCLTLVLLFGCAAAEPAAHRTEQDAAVEAPEAVKTEPPADPNEGTYGVFLPLKALDVLKTLMK